MASGDVWRVTLECAWGSIQCQPGFHLIEGAGGAGVNPAQDVADSVAAALGADPLNGFSDQCYINNLRIEDCQPGLLPTQVFPLAPVAQGTVADLNPLPPQSAAVISLKTGVKGATGVYATAGRMYMPGIPQTGQISGFLQATFQTALSVFASLLFAAYVDDGTAYQWHVVSYTPGSVPRTVRAVNPVTSFSINNVVRSQRRREYGVGI